MSLAHRSLSGIFCKHFLILYLCVWMELQISTRTFDTLGTDTRRYALTMQVESFPKAQGVNHTNNKLLNPTHHSVFSNYFLLKAERNL